MRLRSSKRLWYSMPTTSPRRYASRSISMRLAVFQDQRFHRADVLVMPQRGHDHVVVQLVRHRRDHHIAWAASWRALRGYSSGCGASRVAAVRIRPEALARKGPQQSFRIGQHADGREMQGADGDLSDAPLPLHLVDGRQDLIVRDHAAADDDNCGWYITPPPPARRAPRGTLLRRRQALASAASGDHQRRRDLHRATHRSPTGLNISTPFSSDRRTTSHARSPSGFLVPGLHAGQASDKPLAIAHRADLRIALLHASQVLLQHGAHACARSRPGLPSGSGRARPAPPRSRPDCQCGWRSCCPAGDRSITSGRPTTAESGSELEMPLPKVARSGTMP